MKKKKRIEHVERYGIRFTIEESWGCLRENEESEKVKRANEMLRNVKSWPPELDRYFKK